MNMNSHQSHPKAPVFLRLLCVAGPLLPYLALAVLLGVCGFAAALAIPLLGIYTIAAQPVPHSNAPWLAASMLALAVARGVLRAAEQYCNHLVAFRVLAHLRDRIFEALRRSFWGSEKKARPEEPRLQVELNKKHSRRSFEAEKGDSRGAMRVEVGKKTRHVPRVKEITHSVRGESRGAGDLLALVTSDIELLEVFFAHTISPVMIALIRSGASALLLGQVHWTLGLLALTGYLCVGIVLPLCAAKTSKQTGAKLREASAKLSAFLFESIRGQRELRQFGFVRQREEALRCHQRAYDQIRRRQQRHEGVVTACAGGIILLVAGSGLLLSVQLTLPAEQVCFTVVALLCSFGPVLATANLGVSLSEIGAAGRRVLTILDLYPVTPDVIHGTEVAFRGAAFEDVSFAYEDTNILNHISLALPEKGIIGICGRSGSGKSTLLRLLLRFWDADSGRVCLSGQDLRGVTTASLRANIGFMTQESQFFTASIRENIALSRPDATIDEVTAAAKKAQIHDVIQQLPAGYDTVLTAHRTLSAGELQRLALARAFLHGSACLALDEPTSHLDSLGEAALLDVLRHCHDQSILLVSHRRSTLNLADHVYLMRQGRL